MKLRVLPIALLLLVALALQAPAVLAQETTSGSIEGTVTDQADGGALPGVTVEVEAVQGKKSATTDANGTFRFTFLTPGTYTLRASLQGYVPVERKTIDVRLGSRVRIEVSLSQGSIEKSIEVTAAAPVVDVTTTTTGATISSDLMKNVPIGRTFADTLAIAPGVVDSGIDSSNPSIGGASGLENTYVVDGVNIANTGYGSAGSYSIVFGSLGTGVNFDYIQEVQVKTGGYEPEYGEALGGFVNLVTKTGGNELKGNTYLYWQPEALEGEREEFNLTNATSDNSSRENSDTDIGVDIGGPLAQDKAFWYGAFNPSFNKFSRRTYFEYRNATGIDHTLERERTIWNYAGNLKWFLNPQHTLSFSAFGDPSKGDEGAQRTSPLTLADPEDAFSEIKYGGNNMTGRWNGELASNWFVEGSLSWHKDIFEETLTRNVPAGTDIRVSPTIRLGGAGFFSDDDSRNTQYRVKFSNFFNGGGEHNVRYGIEYQDIGYDHTANYSGQPGILLPDGNLSTSGFTYQLRTPSAASGGEDRFSITRIRSSNLTSETSAGYTAFYGYDSWNITKYINVMAGIRYEQDKLEGNVTDFKWSDNWAPRFHATWDPTKDNKTKIGFSWGRFFGKIPNDLAVRALSTEVSYAASWRISQVDFSDPNNPVPQGDPYAFSILGAEATELVPDSLLTRQDEWTVSAQREVMPFMNVGLTYIHRNLDRTLEDYALSSYYNILQGTETFGHYVIGNPDLDYPDLFPKPSRKYDAVTLSAEKRMHDHWMMVASYTWSELKGNYEGYYRRDNGQSDPFITSLYDFPYLATPEDREIFQHLIADGILPNDRSHIFNLYGSYSFDNELNIGLGLKVQSGIPLTPLGWNEVYDNGNEIPEAPRASAGRGDTVTNFDIHVDYPIKLGSGGQKLYLIGDVFNLFNLQNGVDYNQSSEIGPDSPDPDFGKIITYQDPFQVRLAARFAF